MRKGLYWTDSLSSRGLRALQFFQEITVPQLAGSHDHSLWSHKLLQSACEDVGMRHAIVALSTLHEDFVTTGEAERTKDSFALQQYNLSIRQYIKGPSQARPDCIMDYSVASIIYICIELLQGHYQSALSLIESSVRLFYDEVVKAPGLSRWPLEMIEVILDRFQCQIMGLMVKSFASKVVLPSVRRADTLVIPEQFESVHEANDYFDCYYQTYALSKGSLSAEEIKSYVQILRRWVAAFDAMLASLGPDLHWRDARMVKLLQIQQLMLNLPSQAKSGVASGRDAEFTAIYRQVVDLAESALHEGGAAPIDSSAPHFVFTLDVDVVGPLYDVACGCRDPSVRRRAIALLRRYPRREGLWDSLLAARTAERCMELEEGAAGVVESAADVPEWARVSHTTAIFNVGERRATVIFESTGAPATDSPAINLSEVLEW